MSTHKLKLGHIGLNVTDLSRSLAFYQQVFGFVAMHESQEDDRRFVFLGDGQTVQVTLWQQSEGGFEARTPGLHHLAFEVESIEQVKAYEEKLRALNVPLEYDGIVPHGEGLDSGGIYFRDQDGIRLEIYSPTGASAYQAPHSETSSCGFF